MRFLDNIKISKKLPIIIVLCALLSATIITIVSYVEAKYAVIHADQSKLVALKETRKNQLELYMTGIEQDLSTVSKNPFTLQALKAFEDGWDEIARQGNPTKTLQSLYIKNNPYKIGEKDKLNAARDGSYYSRAHAEYHPWFRSFLKTRNYYDIFMFDMKGNLVYTVYKENDYATNVNTGQWKNTDLGHSFRAARDAQIGENVFFDFKEYAVSDNIPASFIATPIADKNGKKIGVLAFQKSISGLNKIMQAAYGMGESGETYLVGSDFLMRSDSRFSEESIILKTKVDTATVQKALNGESGVEVITDYRGVKVDSAYTPFEFLGTNWAIIAEIDEEESLAPVVQLRNDALITMGIITLIIVLIGSYFARMIAKPISSITGAMEVLATGDTSITVPETGRKDEIGFMSTALETFKQNRIEADRLAKEQKREQEKQLERGKNLEMLTADFETSVSDLVAGLSAASTELNATAQSMSGIAERTTDQSNAMSRASDATTENIQTVASASEELNTAISELSEQVGRTSSATDAAAADVDKTSRQIETLLTSSERIGDVVGLIQDIAEQTNLLALNATIESARAGEAGKGFAVVANEVKSLASETSKATEEISEQVQSVQNEIKGAVDAIKNIEVKIKDVSGAASAIAAAIEEQSATTSEITRNTQISATNMQELNGNVANVNEAAQSTGTAANDVLSASDELSRQTDSLKTRVSEFIDQVKKA